MKIFLQAAVFVAAAFFIPGDCLASGPFAENFSDSTLRIDYIMGKNDSGVTVLVDGMSKSAGWYGRRGRLDELPLEGNGQITVTDPVSGDTLYRHSFSTLFQEWVGTPDAQYYPESFENSFLVPLPKRDAEITITLNDSRRREMARLTHRYRTNDELTAVRRETGNEKRYMHKGDDPNEAIDIAIVAEGYTAEESGEFFEAARKYTDEILCYEPFASRKDKLNFLAVMSPSKESGVSIPLKGDWKETAFGSHFSTFHSERYLTAPRVRNIHDALSGVPYEHIIILVNTDNYGGGGIYNSYLIAAANNSMSNPVVVHEFGHSFGGLADEYFYDSEENDIYACDVEPWEPNITTLVDFDSKWKDMVEPGTPVPTPWKEEKGDRNATMEKRRKEAAKGKEKDERVKVGVYEGGGYKSKGVYRPVLTCRMRDNYNPTLCPVCERAVARIIDFYTGE